MLSSEFYSSLSKDLTSLLTDTSDYNMIINVGEKPNVKEYHVHSNILRVRSKYFSKAVSADWVKKKDGIILYEKPNIGSDVFDIILSYIYGGKITFTDTTSSWKIFDCLKAADELCLDEFLEYAQDYLLENRKEWLKDNLSFMYQDTFPPSSLTKIQGYCINQIRKYPFMFFNSIEFVDIQEECLRELVQDDHLDISELELFEKLIEWGMAKTRELNQTDNQTLSEKNFALLSLTLDKLIKHIRFYNMDSSEFYSRVEPLKSVLGTKFYDEMEVYHNKSRMNLTKKGEGTSNGVSTSYIPKSINLLPHRGAIISKIMNLEQGAMISSWIDRKDLPSDGNYNDFTPEYYTIKNIPYNFKLLLRGSDDGFSASTFHKKVGTYRSTITLFKLKNFDDFFIGGYNPVEWDSPFWPQFKECGNAFLFSFSLGIGNNNNDMSRATITTNRQGRIARPTSEERGNALNMWKSSGPSFGKFDILMQNGGIRLKHKSFVPNIIPLKDGETFKIEDYEVFEVTQKVEDSTGRRVRDNEEIAVEIQ
ncbi:634_t:CDS:2 [Funneliformis geosporum]|nr:634_t:CDS:2 [Funneliformis geosporum]